MSLSLHEIGQRIKAARLKHALTQKGLAWRMTAISGNTEYVHPQEVGRWERGKHLPQPRRQLLLCEVFDGETPESLGFVDSEENTTVSSSHSTLRVAYAQALVRTFGEFSFATSLEQSLSDDTTYVELRLSRSADDTLESLRTGVSLSKAIAATQPARLLILGGPGSGKTTALRHFVYEHARRALADPNAPLPLFISLPDWSRSQKTLYEYIGALVADLVLPQAVGELLIAGLTEGGMLLCFDSLDEVFIERKALLQRLQSVIRNTPDKTVLLVTSRATYRDDTYTLNDLSEWRLLPMDMQRRHTLADLLFASFAPLFGDQYTDAQTFLSAFEAHPRLAQWSREPLLCSLVALLYAMTGQLPHHRHDLYDQIMDALLTRREFLPERRILIKKALASIAYGTLFVRQQRAFSLDDLITLLEHDRMGNRATWDIGVMARDLLNSGLLVPEGKRHYRFIHQVFAEYLTVYHLLSNDDATAIEATMQTIIARMDTPAMVAIACELAYCLHDGWPELERAWYDRVTQRFLQGKLTLEGAHDSADRAREAALVSGLFACIEAVVDIWRWRYCETILQGSGKSEADTALITSLMWPLEISPHDDHFLALRYALYTYPIRGKTLNALGRLGQTGNHDARDLLTRFAQEHYASGEAPLLFRYIAPALALACAFDAVGVLQSVRDDEAVPLAARYAAHLALRDLGEPSEFDEKVYFTLEQIQESLALTIDFNGAGKSGQVADWEVILQMTRWLTQHSDDPAWPWLQAERAHIAAMLEAVLAHPSEHARLPAIRALQRYGDVRTYQFLVKRIECGEEGVLYVAQAMLETLIALAGSLNLSPEERAIAPNTLDHLYRMYPALEPLIMELATL